MQYLLDTDWAIQTLKGSNAVFERVQELEPIGVAISAVTVAEIYDGVFGSANREQDEREFRAFLSGHEVLPFDAEAARIFGQHRRRLRSLGLSIGDMDLLIGATAIQHDLIVLTNNVRHFERIEGIAIESV
ncbi:MAG: type II toxin-antitoxin system VapC family toxin [Chloroflexi bacterium]|nr:type II toxin-antitoxin system VapC family toxin [Chloroflexota bacterium]MDE2709161.1 type II toxin-antitoxin system VapC family toxin [Chloroflexota bacterium]